MFREPPINPPESPKVQCQLCGKDVDYLIEFKTPKGKHREYCSECFDEYIENELDRISDMVNDAKKNYLNHKTKRALKEIDDAMMALEEIYALVDAYGYFD